MADIRKNKSYKPSCPGPLRRDIVLTMNRGFTPEEVATIKKMDKEAARKYQAEELVKSAASVKTAHA